MFEQNNIYYELKNESTGQFNIKIGNNLIVYYCSTGRVLLNNKSEDIFGINHVINLYKRFIPNKTTINIKIDKSNLTILKLLPKKDVNE